MTDPETGAPVPPAAEDGAGESFAVLFRRLGADASTLVRQELALARAELRRSVHTLLGNGGKLLAGTVLAALGGLVLLEALVFGVGDLLGGRYWLAAL
ncbi:MAG TPA: phage holin family protein, partial [Longimicrobium sp.]|nr:phage holin family protein [Longimicrobium sp.]